MFKKALALVGLTLSLSANAVVTNTLNGVSYEWIELSVTLGMSRDDVELRLQNPDDILYGYEYASRGLVEDLLLSYAPWDGVSGFYGDAAIVAGMQAMINDFGYTGEYSDIPNAQMNTVDGYTLSYDRLTAISAIYGKHDECGSAPNVVMSCYGNQAVYTHLGTAVITTQRAGSGWNQFSENSNLINNSYGHSEIASFLVAPTLVPLPSTGWLFISALVGLMSKKRFSR